MLVTLGYGAVIWRILGPWNSSGASWDTFGGGATPFFSGLALAGVIFAIILQSRELKLQRQELELTRTEIARSAEAQEATSNALN